MARINRHRIEEVVKWGVFPVFAAGAIGLAIGAGKEVAKLDEVVSNNRKSTVVATEAAKPQAAAVAKTVVCDTTAMGDGSIRSWVRLDGAGYPEAVGVTFTEQALQGLPTDGGKTCCDGPKYVLALPKDVPGLPFQHVMVNWNPKGHEPAGVYDLPHFDFHFYLLSAEEREAITAEGPDLAKCAKPLPAECVAPGYICPPGTIVPKMGTHWILSTTPELHGQRFTKTFLYGAYDGKIAFVEPMITKAYLESKPDEVIDLARPKQYSVAGYYPSAYRITFDERAREYTVSLERMSAK